MEQSCHELLLLDQIGWGPGEAGDEIAIDLFEHADALRDALGSGRGVARPTRRRPRAR
jgi:hypothetical protein